jgi:3-hydroxybutyryl-CoA dehydrogenase
VVSQCRSSRSLGKEPITQARYAGVRGEQALIPYLLDVVHGAGRNRHGGGRRQAMVHGCGYPMGPITLLDYVGLDTTLNAADVMYAEFASPSMSPVHAAWGMPAVTVARRPRLLFLREK